MNLIFKIFEIYNYIFKCLKKLKLLEILNQVKKIGSKARKDLEVFFKKKIFIEIKVKVSKNWRSSDIELKKFGYK